MVDAANGYLVRSEARTDGRELCDERVGIEDTGKLVATGEILTCSIKQQVGVFWTDASGCICCKPKNRP